MPRDAVLLSHSGEKLAYITKWRAIDLVERGAAIKVSDRPLEVRFSGPPPSLGGLSRRMSAPIPVRRGRQSRKSVRALPSVRIRAPRRRGRSVYEKLLDVQVKPGQSEFKRAAEEMSKDWNRTNPRGDNREFPAIRGDGRGGVLYFPRPACSICHQPADRGLHGKGICM